MYFQYSPNRSETVFITGSGNNGEVLTSSDYIPFKNIGGYFSERWDSINNIFKVPKNGIYIILANILATANVAGFVNLINGSRIEAASPSSGIRVVIVEYAGYLNAGEEIGLKHTSSITLNNIESDHYIKIIGWT